MGYDGIHPTETGYALIANEWIAFLNRETGTDLRPVELAPFIFGTTGTSTSIFGAAPSTPGAAEFSQEAFDQLRALFAPVDVR